MVRGCDAAHDPHVVAVDLPQSVHARHPGSAPEQAQIGFHPVAATEVRSVRLPVPDPAGEAVAGRETDGGEHFERFAGTERLPAETAGWLGEV